MSEAATCIDEVQRILSEREWQNDTVERVGETLKAYGFDEWTKESPFENRYLRLQWIEELATEVESICDMWVESIDTRYQIPSHVYTGIAAHVVLNIQQLIEEGTHAPASDQ
jgi:hypothetical protein